MGFSLFWVPPYFPAAVVALNSALWFFRRERLWGSYWNFSHSPEGWFQPAFMPHNNLALKQHQPFGLSGTALPESAGFHSLPVSGASGSCGLVFCWVCLLAPYDLPGHRGGEARCLGGDIVHPPPLLLTTLWGPPKKEEHYCGF